MDHNRAEAPDLKMGDWVYVKAKYFRTSCPSKKLSEKNLGPFEVIGIPGTHSFTICLPQQFQTVHLVFHISQLEPEKPDPFPLHQQPPPPPMTINGNLEYEVSEIPDSKINC